MSPFTPESLALLCGLCLLPVLLVFVVGMLPRKETVPDKIVSGNALLEHQPLPQTAAVFLQPMIHAMRTRDVAELRGLVLGLRHLPLQQTAPILKYALHRSDPELQIYAQSILQEKQERLQAAIARPDNVAMASDLSLLANFLEGGVKLIASPLTQASELAPILKKVWPKMEELLQTRIEHPRALAAGIELCLLAGRPQEATVLLKRLPEGSPLHEKSLKLLSHHLAIHQPPKPASVQH